MSKRFTNELSTQQRILKIGEPQPMDKNPHQSTTNYIRTTKYTAVTFLPLSLFNQFKRYANIYFLIVAILQSIPAISPLNPLSAIAPLIFVVSLSMIREGYEDLKRYQADLETNSKKTKRYVQEKDEWEVDVEWKDLKVGDIIRIEDEQYFPADVIVLTSSNADGSCFIMTSSLDGEKNLKPKFAIQGVQQTILQKNSFKLKGQMEYGLPNIDLFSFSGELKLEEQSFGVSAKQLMLRESQLKNTEFIVGVVVYTGKDTKIMQNADDPRFKQSQLEMMTNKLIIFLIIFEIILCLVCMIGSIVWNSDNSEKYSYFIRKRYSGGGEGILTFFTVFILLNTMIPISLIISLEMVKFTQAYFIDQDIDMRNAEGEFCKTYNSSINEELGQIEYVFSDKTGTLTCNIMEFVYCFIGNTGFGSPEILQDNVPSLVRQPTYKNKKAGVQYSFDNPELRRLLKKELPGKKENEFVFKSQSGQTLYELKNLQEMAHQFFLILSVNHDCMLEAQKSNNNDINYQGPSPDEVALVDTARHMGYEFKKTTNKGKLINVNGTDCEIEVLQSFEFTSKRKRSSIIVKEDGVIKLFSKGADNIIIERLSKKAKQPYLDFTIDRLEKFSLKGLRTLCYAMKVYSQEEWKEIERKINALNSDPQKEEKLDLLSEEIEKDLTLIGCTAVEDKLQDRVPEVIANLLETNIKVWMLTGDKLETAENIGFSCKLIQSDYKKIYLRAEQGKTNYEEKDLEIKYNELNTIIEQKQKGDKYSLIVEGPMIINLTNYEELAKKFILNVFSKCDSVVCCRMSPKQKGEIVRFVKKHQSKITLAIGDGANDVNMIQEAHIGIGLYGKEGLRAVQASDYALREFQNLWKLLFVHGRWSYIRNSEMILYFYYKNIVFAMPQFYYCLYNAWSGQTLFDDFYITFYNMAFTALPVIIRAIFDQDIYYKEYNENIKNFYDLKRYYHHLYYVGQQNLIFDKKIIALWMINSIVQSLIIYFFGISIANSFIITEDGWEINLWYLSITLFTIIIFVVDIKILFFTRFFTWCSIFSVFVFSIGLYICYFFIADYVSVFYIYKTANALLLSPIFYLSIILIVGIAIMFDMLILILEREIRTPLYLLFKSLMQNQNMEKQEYFELIVNQVKNNIYDQKEEKNKYT